MKSWHFRILVRGWERYDQVRRDWGSRNWGPIILCTLWRSKGLKSWGAEAGRVGTEEKRFEGVIRWALGRVLTRMGLLWSVPRSKTLTVLSVTQSPNDGRRSPGCAVTYGHRPLHRSTEISARHWVRWFWILTCVPPGNVSLKLTFDLLCPSLGLCSLYFSSTPFLTQLLSPHLPLSLPRGLYLFCKPVLSRTSSQGTLNLFPLAFQNQSHSNHTFPDTNPPSNSGGDIPWAFPISPT